MGRAFEVRKASMMKTSIAKSKVYSKYGKEIYVVAKNGQPDPELNPSLKRIIEKAKKDQVPADVIKRAIEKAKGGGGENYEFTRYEGFGPNNSMIMVDCLTDNVNRTVSDVKNCFTKSNSKMGVSGCVSHMFVHQSIFSFKGNDEEEILELLLMNECDVDDIENEEGVISIYADHTQYFNIKKCLEDNYEDLELLVDEKTWVPSTYVQINTEDDNKNYEKLMNMLNELDDVQEIYHNIIIK